MKKLKALGLFVAVAGAASLLAACNDKDNTSSTTTSAETSSAVVSKYVKDFNSTQSFINRYTNQEFNFNAALPLSGKFVQVLNDLSNGAKAVSEAPVDQRALVEDEVLLTVNDRFLSYVDAYKNDKPAYTADFPNGDIDLDTANLKDLLDQLQGGCSTNNDYQADLDSIKRLEVKDENGNVIPFPAEVENEVVNWNANFKNTCNLAKDLYKIVSAPNFSYADLKQQVAAKRAADAQPAAPATEEAAPAETPAAPAEAPANK
ncbi:hypothetical protein [Psittacicella hinzii]|uniref:Lipoprotein n=1 Tax=Psittacicella hinzii TaxID=2028575 RepID=A0A3A1YC94_9GAMM|nr:hypothetical protein [Psittacicella hinzii]RIY34790.1 hypothetical protein CKF58_07650 [Psittacicella hinzii]